MGQIQEHGRELPIYKRGFLCSRVQICGLDETSTKTVCWEMGNKREQTNHCRPGPLQGGDSLSYWSVILPDEGNDRCQGRRGRARVHVDAGGYHLRRARAKGWFGSRTQRPRNAYDWSGKKNTPFAKGWWTQTWPGLAVGLHTTTGCPPQPSLDQDGIIRPIQYEQCSSVYRG